MDLNDIRRVAVGAAHRGGRVLRERLGKIGPASKKGPIDLVTEADTGSETAILSAIRANFPDHSILAEESGRRDGDPDRRWIIDPLDGTTNYAHQIPVFSVSIAFSLQGRTVVGVVLNPVSGELFTATEGGGAFLNGGPIRVSDTDAVDEALLVTGFPYNFKENWDRIGPRFARCLHASQGVRRYGSAALDLCFVAAGRFDGFWEENLHPWDTAAGALIVREAGGRVTDFSDAPHAPDAPEILATNGAIHPEMITLLEPKDSSP
ncbi:MAG: inositol monophosphatase family protein [Desulfococcaceae bacterium]